MRKLPSSELPRILQDFQQLRTSLVRERMVNNVQKNAEQRQQPKQLGGITGRGFMSGQSGNPHGRPHRRDYSPHCATRSRRLPRTANHRGTSRLVQEALRGRHRLPAVEAIFDRLEGRATQQLNVRDVSADLRSLSDEELEFHLVHDRWPSDDELLMLGSKDDGC